MAMISGEYKCKCGCSFEWSVITSVQNEVVVFWVDRSNKNAKLVEHFRDKDVIEVRCPQCNARNTIVQKR